MASSQRVGELTFGRFWACRDRGAAAAVVLLMAGACLADDADPNRPGATDPRTGASQGSVLPDHKLLAAGHSASGQLVFQVCTETDDKDLPFSGPYIVGDVTLSAPYAVGLSAGRFTDPNYDQVAFLAYGDEEAGSGQCTVGLFDSHLTTKTKILRCFAVSLPAADKQACAEYFVMPFDVVSADLDGMGDVDGVYHFEIATAYAGPEGGTLRVDVMDYQGQLLVSDEGVRHVGPAVRIRAAIGDFNSNGLLDIAVVYRESGGGIYLSVFEYAQPRALDTAPPPTLSLIDTTTILSAAPDSLYVDVTAGDLNGDEKDDIAIAWGGDGGNLTLQVFQVFTDASTGAESLQPRGHLVATPAAGIYVAHALLSKGPITLEAGVFEFNPTQGFGTGRKQLSCSYTEACVGEEGSAALFWALATRFDVSNDLSGITQKGYVVANLGTKDDKPLIGLQTAVGSYHAGTGDPTSSVASCMRSSLPGDVFIQDFRHGPWDHPYVYEASGARSGITLSNVVAFDADGSSLLVGGPLHFTISELHRADYVIHEPPKHIDYLVDPTDGQAKVVNLSRKKDFYASMSDSSSQSLSTKHTDKTSWNIGGSLEVKVGEEVEESAGIEKAKLSGSVSAKVAYDYDQSIENSQTNYESRTSQYTGRTDSDDYVVATVRVVDIWRYPLYGSKATNDGGQPLHAYYEIVIPGPVVSYRGGGSAMEWYQPVHENGNILSYPQLAGGTYTPPDLGSFTLGDDPNTVLTMPLAPATLLSWGGTSEQATPVSFSDQSGAGSIRSYTNKLSESVDLTASGEVGYDAKFAKEKTSVKVSANFHNSNTWGGSSVSDSQTSSSRGITVNLTSGDLTRGYLFAPVVYITDNGAIKVAHAVDALGHDFGKSWWLSTYGGRPDAALNLPAKFRTTDGGSSWELNPGLNRKKMRGFFANNAEHVDPLTGRFNPLSEAPVAGQKVEIRVRVYNYSVGKSISGLDVLFQTAPYDATSPDENASRRTIGRTTIAQLVPQTMQEAAIIWDTTQWAPASGVGSQDYLVYVVLDPDNKIDEIHEWKDADGKEMLGQNNEGYGEITVHSSASVSAAKLAGLGKPVTELPDVSLEQGSLALLTPAGTMSEGVRGNGSDVAVRAWLNQPVRLSLAVYTDISCTDHQHVLIFDGDPDDGAPLIAGKIVQGVMADGSTRVWVDWTPTEAGEHEIHAVLLESPFDSAPGNHRDVIRVSVTKEPPWPWNLGPFLPCGQGCGPLGFGPLMVTMLGMIGLRQRQVRIRG
ncbi:MAG: hypothetical protein JXQ73_22690 [Phycisphaerae bacterium]|nr:hypothetical protein [Phycisphaerae bacterium]